MKLVTKLTIFLSVTKLAVVLVFVLMLPWLIGKVSYEFTNYNLRQQRGKVMAVISKNGVDYYLQGDSSYGSYTMLREEYISLGPVDQYSLPDTITTSRRLVEGDTLNYRVLSYRFAANRRPYVLEIGKTVDTIGEYNVLLQRFTLYTLIVLIAITIIIDLLFTHRLLRPLGKIISSKILNRKFPFREDLQKVPTTTTDFRYLDDSLIALMERVHTDFEKEREFTANASHELMTPISILQSKIENLTADANDATQERAVELMRTLSRLKKIVQSLLYISRIENEQFVKQDIVNVSALVQEVLGELEDRVDGRSLRVAVDIPADFCLQSVNRDLIFQMIYNLVNNAIRYNVNGGSITISGSLEDDAQRLCVTDTGIGIEPDLLPHIFDRFRKKTAAGGEKGYGLGLSIVKAIAEFHGITISVKSQPGAGTGVEMFHLKPNHGPQ